MGLIDKLKNKAYTFLWTVALKKGAKQLAAVAMAYIASLPLETWGVAVSFEEAAVVAALTALLEVGRNWLKHKVGVKGL